MKKKRSTRNLHHKRSSDLTSMYEHINIEPSDDDDIQKGEWIKFKQIPTSKLSSQKSMTHTIQCTSWWFVQTVNRHFPLDFYCKPWLKRFCV